MADSPPADPNDKEVAPALAARRARFWGSVNFWVALTAGVAILLMVNFLANRWYYRVDFSDSQNRELSPRTIEVLRNLPEPIQVTTFFSKRGGFQSARVAKELHWLLEEYEYFGRDKIEIRHLDPAYDINEYRKHQEELKFSGDEDVVIIRFGPRAEVIKQSELAEFEPVPFGKETTSRLRQFFGEQQITSAMIRALEGKAATVYFLTGHGERSFADSVGTTGMGEAARFIERENIKLRPLNLGAEKRMPEDADALIIAGPRLPLDRAEARLIEDYLDAKGKLLLLQDADVTSGLETVLQQYGLRLNDDQILLQAIVSVGGVRRQQTIGEVIGSQFARHPVTQSMRGFNVKFPTARSLTIDSKGTAGKARSLVETSKSYWAETNLGELKPVFDPNVDRPGPLTVVGCFDGAVADREGIDVSGTRIVVVGSSTFALNTNIVRSPVAVDLIVNSLNWMLKRDYASEIAPKRPREFALNVTAMQYRFVVALALGAVPVLALLACVFVTIARRK